MLRLAFDFIITWRETRTRPNAYCGELIITAAFANNHYLITDEYLLYDGCLMGA